MNIELRFLVKTRKVPLPRSMEIIGGDIAFITEEYEELQYQTYDDNGFESGWKPIPRVKEIEE